MTAKEFFEQNRGKYFNYECEKVRVVGYGTYSDQRIIISRDSGWEYNEYSAYIGEICTELIEYGKLCSYVDIADLTPIDQPELDLCKILEGCEGMTFYSSIHGNVILKLIRDSGDDHDPIIVILSDGDTIDYCKDGRYLSMYDGECTLFPSKENRDWSTFVKPINEKVLKDGDYVMCGDNVFQTELRQYFKDNKCYASGINNRRSILKAEWKYIIPFEYYDPSLSEEELKKLSIV